METFNEIIAVLSTYSILLPIAAGLFIYRHLILWYRLFVFFLLFGFAVDLYCTFVENSNPIFNIYRLVEGLFCTAFLFRFLNFRYSKELFIFIFLSLIIVYAVTHFLWLDNYNLQNLNAGYDMFASVVLSLCAAAVMLQLAQRNEQLSKDPSFWFATSLFIYFFCTNFLFSLIGNRELLFKIWFIHNLINIITYLIDTKAFLCIKPKT